MANIDDILMDDMVMNHLQDLYGLNPHIPHIAFQFPRLPPGLSGSMFKVNEIPMKEQFSQNASTMSQKLRGFPAHVSTVCIRT